VIWLPLWRGWKRSPRQFTRGWFGMPCSEERLCSLFYLNTIDSGALESVEVLERWTAHPLDRKSMVRAALEL